MTTEPPWLRIGSEIAALRALFPAIDACHAALDEWFEGGTRHFSVRLDIRRPRQQTLVCGAPARAPEEAVAAAFAAARERLRRSARAPVARAA